MSIKRQCEVCGAEVVNDHITDNICTLCHHLLRMGIPYGYLHINKSLFKKAEMLRHIDSQDSFYIHGKIGTGKTWLMSAIMREATAKTMSVDDIGATYVAYSSNGLFISLPELAVKLRGSMRSDSNVSESYLLNKYSKVPVLFLDDVGADRATGYVKEQIRAFLYLLIERRATGRNLRTVITSNLNLSELAQEYEERISSRIAGMCKVVRMGGKDRRPERS